MTATAGVPRPRLDRINVATVITVCTLFGCCLAVLVALPFPLALLAGAALASVVLATLRATRRLETILREETTDPLR